MGGVGGKGVFKNFGNRLQDLLGDPAGPVGPKISRVFSFWGAVVVIHLGAGSGCRRHVSGTILRQIAMQAMAVREIPHDARHLARLCQACAQGPQERPRSVQSALPDCSAWPPPGVPRKPPGGLPAQCVKIV